MPGPMIACPSCSEYVLVRDASCPHCGATVRTGGQVLGRTAGAVLMGLSLAGCPAGDDTSETMGNGSSTTAGSTSAGSTAGSTTDNGSTSSFDVSSGPVGEAYGAPDTETFGTDPTDTSTTGGDTDTDTDTEGTTGTAGSSGGSTSLGPDYGVPTTSGE